MAKTFHDIQNDLRKSKGEETCLLIKEAMAKENEKYVYIDRTFDTETKILNIMRLRKR